MSRTSKVAPTGKLSHASLTAFAIAALVALVFLTFYPALSSGFVWDDDDNVTENMTLRSAKGLSSIWLDPHSNQQYYPLTHTSFWVEYQLFGLQPWSYHLVNLLLHAASAALLFVILRGLSVPGAWLAAAVFAIHPLQVESVAWVTERKNTLAGLFLMLAVLVFLRHAKLLAPRPGSAEPARRSKSLLGEISVPATVLFILALASKTAVATAPLALLAILWWKRDRLGVRDAIGVAPMLVLGVLAGSATAWLERHHVGAAGSLPSFGILERLLLAGRALWFYAAKFVWPRGQVFIYPSWTPRAGDLLAWILVLAAASVPVALCGLRRHIGKGPAAAALAYGLLIAPASGFFDLYFFVFSFVQDHFQYFACMALSALLGAVLAALLRRPAVFASVSAGIVLVLAVASWRRVHVFRDAETLWLDTIARNGDAWMARGNLAKLLIERDDPGAAVAELREALRLRPGETELHNLLGSALSKTGDTDGAIEAFRSAIRTKPGSALLHYNLGIMLAREGRLEEAIEANRQALRIDPRALPAWKNLANVLFRAGAYQESWEAVEALRRLGGSPRPEFVRDLEEALRRSRGPATGGAGP